MGKIKVVTDFVADGTVPFGDMCVGQVFEWESMLYMKIVTPKDTPSEMCDIYKQGMAVGLEAFRAYVFDFHEMCRKHNATLTITPCMEKR